MKMRLKGYKKNKYGNIMPKGRRGKVLKGYKGTNKHENP